MSEIVFNTPTASSDLKSQVENLQTTLASLNQQVIILQEALAERDERIKDLGTKLSERKQEGKAEVSPRVDDTLTLIGVLIKLYKFFLPGKAV